MVVSVEQEHGITSGAYNDIEGGGPYPPPRAMAVISEIEAGAWGQMRASIPYLPREPPNRLETHPRLAPKTNGYAPDQNIQEIQRNK